MYDEVSQLLSLRLLRSFIFVTLSYYYKKTITGLRE
jgi:hypothetical protein